MTDLMKMYEAEMEWLNIPPAPEVKV
jgi:hypothetical protein